MSIFRPVLTLLAVLALLAGCAGAADQGNGGGAGATTPAPDDTGGSQLAAPSMAIPAGLVDPCGLMSSAEIKQVSTVDLKAGQRSILEDGTYVDCTWYDADPSHPELGTPVDLKLEPKTQNNSSFIGTGSGVDQISGIAGAAQLASKNPDPLHAAQVDGYKGAIKYTIHCGLPGELYSHPTPTAYDICVGVAKLIAPRLP